MPAQSEQFVSYSLFWFTLSLVNAGLAQAKQRSGLGWWLASLFLGRWQRCSSSCCHAASPCRQRNSG